MKELSRGKVLAAAALLGIVAAGLVYFYLARQSAMASQSVEAVVAVQNIPSDTVIDSRMLRMVDVPQGSLPVATATSLSAVVGRIAVADIKAGDPITLRSISEKYRLAHIVPPFMRAVTVAVDPVIGVGGFLKAGDHVDVIATFSSFNGSYAKIILQDVELMAIGPSVVSEGVDPDTGQKTKPQAVTNVTLCVSPADAEKLVLAESKGKLRLALRRSDDPAILAVQGVSGESIMGTAYTDNKRSTYSPPTRSERTSTAAPSRRLPSAPPALFPLSAPEPVRDSSETVTVIRGTKTDEEAVPK